MWRAEAKKAGLPSSEPTPGFLPLSVALDARKHLYSVDIDPESGTASAGKGTSFTSILGF